MSKKTCHSPSSRFKIVIKIKELIEEGHSVKEACGILRVSPSSYRRWRDKLSENTDFLEREEIDDYSCAPKTFARQVSEINRQRVIEEASEPSHTSANSIAESLKKDGLSISTAKAIKILEEEEIYGEIHVTNAKGEPVRKRGLLRLCEKRQQGR